jgi:hypothetical protein
MSIGRRRSKKGGHLGRGTGEREMNDKGMYRG